MVAHGRDTSPAVSADAQLSTHCNSLGETLIFECAAGNYATALKAASSKMPNWMECGVKIIGPTDEIARFRNARIGNDQDGELQLVTGLSRCDPRSAAPSRCRVNK
jgi:hypothetical protein